MPFINPSVGRVVHFYTKDTKRHSNGQGEGPYPAIIVQTFDSENESGMSNLYVMSWDGPYSAGSVAEKGFAQNTGQQSWWEWPPRT